MGQNSTQQKQDKFWETNINRKSPPRGYLQRLLEMLGETTDISNMNNTGLSGRLQRIKNPGTVEIWKQVVQHYQAAISRNDPIPSSSSAPVAAALQTTEDNEDDHRVVTTSLRQLVREEHSLVDIEQQLIDKQRVNHETFAAFSNVIQEATDLVRLVSLTILCWFFYFYIITNFLPKSDCFGESIW